MRFCPLRVYHVSLWALNSKAFRYYSTIVILHSWSPILQMVLLLFWDGFFVVLALVVFHFFLIKVAYSHY